MSKQVPRLLVQHQTQRNFEIVYVLVTTLNPQNFSVPLKLRCPNSSLIIACNNKISEEIIHLYNKISTLITYTGNP